MFNDLNWPKAFLLGCMFIAGAILFTNIDVAQSQSRGAGYMVASNGSQFTWRVNTVTGAVSYCVRRDNSLDRGFIGAPALLFGGKHTDELRDYI